MRGSSGVAITSPNHPNLVAMYTMDNISGATLFDESANSHDGTISSASAVSGHIGDALDFATVDATVVLPTAVIQAPASVAFWVKLSTVGTNALCASHKSSDGLSSVQVLPGGVLASIYVDNAAGTFHRATADTTGSLTGYSFYVATYDGTLTFYVDGALSGKTLAAGTDINPWFTKMDSVGFANLGMIERLGVNNNGDGQIDQLRVFNRVLTLAEVTELYNGGTGA